MPAGDLRTGKRLHEDVAVQEVFHERGLAVDYVQANTAEQFWTCLGQVLEGANARDECPILHIECHGSDDSKGLILADGSFVAWERLKPLFTAVNMATRLNLLVVLGACFGAYLAQIIHPTDRAPVWGMMGPTESAKPNDLLASFSSFYGELLGSLDGDRALAALLAADSRVANYYFTSAQMFFKTVYSGYLKESGSDRAYWQRGKGMRQRLRSEGIKPPNLQQIQSDFKRTERASFDKYRRQFFMIDLYPENAERFVVTFDEAVKPRTLSAH